MNIPTLEMTSKVFLVVFILATTLLLQSEAFHVGTAGDLRLGKKRDSLPSRIQVKYILLIPAKILDPRLIS